MLCYLLHASRGRFGASAQPRPAANTTVPVRGNLAGYGPMARNAADAALELEVLAGPNELPEGVGGLQSRIAAAARKVGRFPRAGDQHASALPDRGRHQERAKRARRFVSRSVVEDHIETQPGGIGAELLTRQSGAGELVHQHVMACSMVPAFWWCQRIRSKPQPPSGSERLVRCKSGGPDCRRAAARPGASECGSQDSGAARPHPSSRCRRWAGN